MLSVIIQTKRCSKCGQIKLHSEFDTNGHNKSGEIRLHSWCKKCLREYNHKWHNENPEYFRNWAEDNHDKVHDSQVKYRINSPEKCKANRARYNELHLEKILQYSQNYRAEHPEQIRTYMQKYNPGYYLNHKDELIEYQRHWRATPMGKIVQMVTRLKRRAAKMGADIGDVNELIKQIKLSPVVICYLCGRSLPGNKCHIDHIIPLLKGGAHVPENIAPACPTCNIKKGAKILPANFQQTWVCR